MSEASVDRRGPVPDDRGGGQERETGCPAAVPEVSVVICAYTERRWDDLVRAVASVRAQTVAPREVVLVVDHNAALFERARRRFPGVTLLANGGGRGLSDARNAGLAAVRTPLVAFLDDDASAEPTWLERLVAPYRDPAVVGTGGAVEPAWATARPRWFPEEFLWVVGCSYRGLPRVPAPVRNPIGASMSFRTPAARAAGGFRREVGRIGAFPIGCEETALAIQVRRQTLGGVVLHVPGAVVRHRVPAERTTWRYFLARCYAEGRSKATVSRLVGGEALASERAYVRGTLTRAVVRGLVEAATLRDFAGLAHAAAVVAGLAATAAGYARGRFVSAPLIGRGRGAARLKPFEAPIPAFGWGFGRTRDGIRRREEAASPEPAPPAGAPT